MSTTVYDNRNRLTNLKYINFCNPHLTYLMLNAIIVNRIQFLCLNFN